MKNLKSNSILLTFAILVTMIVKYGPGFAVSWKEVILTWALFGAFEAGKKVTLAGHEANALFSQPTVWILSFALIKIISSF